MADPSDENIFELEELVVQPGTYFNPQTEVIVVVDDSTSLDQEVFDMEAYEGADWVRISEDVPVDEDQFLPGQTAGAHHSKALARTSPSHTFEGIKEVGTFFWQDSDLKYRFCAGTVVPSPGKDLVLTAAHCFDSTDQHKKLVFVPIGRGLMQPYERPRRGDLAGTVGSRSPSFPVAALPSGPDTPVMAPSAPTSLTPLLFEQTTGSPVPASAAAPSAPAGRAEDVAAAVPVARLPLTPAEMQAVRERVWIDFRGQKWVPAGPAIPLAGSGFREVRRASFVPRSLPPAHVWVYQ